MERSLPRHDRSTFWLADLIETTEALAASDERCDPAIVGAFSHRLQSHANAQPVFDFVHTSVRG